MTTPTPKDNPPFDPPVFCSGIERDCKHGQLARSCNICELERDLAAAQAENAKLKAHADRLHVNLAYLRSVYPNTDPEVVSAMADYRRDFPKGGKHERPRVA